MEERYGIHIDVKDYAEMCERVDKKKDVKFISEERLQQVYDMSFKCLTCPTKIVRVVWSRANRCIKTVLPMED